MEKYFKYDDEYISGWQYFFRCFLQTFLCLVLVGFYLNSVTSYKRAKSLGNRNGTCNFFAVWGGLSFFIAFIPGLNIINVILHWYLWFSNGTPPIQTGEDEKELKIQELEHKIRDLESEQSVRKEEFSKPISHHQKNIVPNSFSRQISTDVIEQSEITQELEKLFLDNRSVQSIKIYSKGKVERLDGVDNIKIELSAFEHTLYNYYNFLMSRLKNTSGEIELVLVFKQRLSIIHDWFGENSKSNGKKLGILK